MDSLNQVLDDVPKSTWSAVLTSTLYYAAYPVIFLFGSIYRVALVILSPLIALLSFAAHVLWLPIHILGKFESIYVFFGVAAIIGALTGVVLHFSSSFLGSILDLRKQAPPSPPPDYAPPVDSKRLSQERLLKFASQTGLAGISPSTLAWYEGPLRKGPIDGRPGRHDKGLLNDIILEEDSEGSRRSSSN